MLIVVILIAISLTIALLFLGLFLWSMKSGQFDDVYTPSVRILFESSHCPDKPFNDGTDKNQDSDKV